MTELTTSQLIKILVGIFVVVVVVVGIFLFFRNTVIDFIKNLPSEGEETSGGQIGDGSQIEQDDEEAKFNLKIECESSGCTDKSPEDLKCNFLKTKVKGYYHECTNKGDCVRIIWRKEIQECDYGCTDGECDSCLPSETVIGEYVLIIGTPDSFCCNGYYCTEKILWTICKEQRCN